MNPKISNPYVGPRTFREDERGRFFGRERESSELRALVLSEQLVLFYAQSGAGKSSLLNTCLIPELREREFEILRGRVGGDAPAEIEVDNVFTFNLLRSLVTEEASIHSLASLSLIDFLAPNGKVKIKGIDRPHGRRILIIDQFEEIFNTHQENWEKREGFFQQLAEVLDAIPRLKLILVMREDFIASLDPYSHLLPDRLRMRYYMQQLEVDTAIAAVKEPVKSEEFSRPYAVGVAEKLVDDIRSIKVTLPDGTPAVRLGQFVEPLFLQVICYDVWENLHSVGPEITQSDLQQVGDVNEFLKNYYAKRVKTVAKEQNVSERKIRKWIEDELISSSGVRKMVLQEPGGVSRNLDNRVIKELSDLVRTEQRGGATFYELTHDRMVEPILANNKNWEEKNTSLLQKQAALWAQHGRADTWLFANKPLKEAVAWAKANPNDLTEVENSFLAACRKRQNAQRFNLLLAATFVIIGMFFIYFLRKSASDKENSIEQEKIARSSSLSTIAMDMADRQLDMAILLGLEADSNHRSPQTENTFFTLLQKSGRLQNFFIAGKSIQSIQLSPDQKRFAVLDKDGVTILDVNGKKLNGPFTGLPVPVSSTAFSPDGNILASSSKDGGILLWSVKSGRQFGAPLVGHTQWVNNVVFSKDGKTLVSASDDGTIIIWNIEDPGNPKRRRTIDLHTGVNDVRLNQNGTVAATDGRGTLYFWDINELTTSTSPLASITSDTTILKMDFSPDGSLLAYGDLFGNIYLWDVSDPANPTQVKKIDSENGLGIYCVAFSPDGKTLVVGSADGRIDLWDVPKPETPTRLGDLPLSHHIGVVTSISFSPDGTVFASGGADGKINLWDVAKRKFIRSYPSGSDSGERLGAVNSVKFDPTKNLLSVGGENGSILLLDISDKEVPQVAANFPGKAGVPTRTEFSANNRFLMVYTPSPTLYHPEAETAVIYDTSTGKQIGTGKIVFQDSQGRVLLVSGPDNTAPESLYLYDLSNGKISDPIPGSFLALSSDNTTLASQTVDLGGHPLIQLWGLKFQKEKGDAIQGEYLAAQGDVLAYQTSDENNALFINLLDLNTGNQIGSPITGSFLALLQNGHLLEYQTFTSDGETEVVIMGIGNSKEIITLPGNSNSLPVASQNSEALAYAMYDSENGYVIKSLDINTGEYFIDIPISNSVFPPTISWSNDGKVLLVSSYAADGSQLLTAYNVNSGIQIGDSSAGYFTASTESAPFLTYETFDPKTGENSFVVTNVSTGVQVTRQKGTYKTILEHGKTLIYEDDGINVLDIASGQKIGNPLTGTLLGVSADEKSLFTQTGDKILVWNLAQTWPLGDPVGINTEASTAALSPDGKMLAWIGEHGIALQDVSNTVQNAPFNDHYNNIFPGEFLAFSPNGRLMAIANTSSKTITIWGITDGKQVGTTSFPGTSAVFSPSGDFIAVGDSNTYTTTVWDPASGKKIGDEIPGEAPVFSSNGALLAVGNSSTHTTVMWSVANRQIVSTLQGEAPLFSPNDRVAIVRNVDANTAIVWDLNTDKQLGNELPPYTSPIFSSDGALMAIPPDSTSNITTLWDLNKAEQIPGEFAGTAPVFSPDGKLLAVGNYNTNTTMVWDLNTRETVATQLFGYIPIFSPDGNLLAVGDYSANTTSIWDFKKNEELATQWPGYTSVFSPDGKTLAIEDYNAYVTTAWDLKSGKPIGEALPGNSAVFSPNSTLLGVGNDQAGATKFLELAKGETLDRDFQGFLPVFTKDGRMFAMKGSSSTLWTDLGQPISLVSIVPTSLVFSSDGKTLASLASDGIVLSDVNTHKFNSHLTAEGYTSQFVKMSFYGKDTRMAALSGDGTLITWDASSGVATIPDEQPLAGVGGTAALAFSPDGNFLIYQDGNQLSVWDVLNNKNFTGTESLPAFENQIGTISFNPEGTILGYSDGGRVILVQLFPELTKIGELPTEFAQINNLGIIMDGAVVKYLVTRNEQGDTQVWNWETRTKTGDPMSGNLQFVASNTAHQMLIYIDSVGQLIQLNWNLTHDQWRDLLCPRAGRNLSLDEWNTYLPEKQYPRENANLTCSSFSPGK